MRYFLEKITHFVMRNGHVDSDEEGLRFIWYTYDWGPFHVFEDTENGQHFYRSLSIGKKTIWIEGE